MEDRLSDEEVVGQVASVLIYSLFDALLNIYDVVHWFSLRQTPPLLLSPAFCTFWQSTLTSRRNSVQKYWKRSTTAATRIWIMISLWLYLTLMLSVGKHWGCRHSQIVSCTPHQNTVFLGTLHSEQTVECALRWLHWFPAADNLIELEKTWSYHSLNLWKPLPERSPN